MPGTDTECQGTWRNYHGPTDGPIPEDAWLMRCDGCGQVEMFTTNNHITLIPGRTNP